MNDTELNQEQRVRVWKRLRAMPPEEMGWALCYLFGWIQNSPAEAEFLRGLVKYMENLRP